MAIPAGPPNISKATAVSLEWQANQDRYYYIQTTSTLGYDPATPPAPPLPPPIYYDIWFKAANAEQCKGSVTVHNLSQGVTSACIVTVYDENNVVIGEGSTVQWEPHKTSMWTYFKIHTPDNIPLADVVVDIVVNMVRGGPILAGSMVFQDETTKGPLAIVIGTAQAFNFIRHVVNGSNPTDTNHTLNGKYGDVLPSGETCIEDQAIKGVTIRNRNYGVPLTEAGEDGSISVPLGLPTINDLYYIRRNADGRNFWLSYLFAGSPIVRSIFVTNGTLGPIFDVGGKVIAMCARADQLLYYTVEAEPMVVRIWDLVRNVRLANLTVPTAMIRDIIITSTGDIIVLYYGVTSAHVYRYNPAGTILSAFQLPTIDSACKINYAGGNPNQFMVLTHEPGIAVVTAVNLQNGQLYAPIKIKKFNAQGGYINVPDLYEKKEGNVYIGPNQRVGPGVTSNFWIQPVTSKGGCYVPYTNVPDDEFFPPTFPPLNYPDFGQNPSQSPGGVYPYPPDPPETPPVIPINPPPPAYINPANIGGGLVVIEPSNGIRHDVYQGRNVGETLSSPIVVFIRTAFLGD